MLPTFNFDHDPKVDFATTYDIDEDGEWWDYTNYYATIDGHDVIIAWSYDKEYWDVEVEN